MRFKTIQPYLQLIRFNKPIGSLLLLWPTLWALFIAAHGKPPVYAIMVFGLGVFLTRSAGCAINDFADKEIDKYVARTATRPLVSGSLTKRQALITSFSCSVLAFLLAITFLSYATILMSIPALLLLLSYPFMKRFFLLPQLYLGIAFSFAILMVYIEIVGAINISAILLFIANLLWVFGYDTIYALVDKQDDLKIGIKTSAITLGKHVVVGVKIAFAGFIGLMIVVGYINNLSLFYWLSLLVATSLLLLQVVVLHRQLGHLYFRMFLLNNWVGFVICAGIIFALAHK